jgi:hypothetical protein
LRPQVVRPGFRHEQGRTAFGRVFADGSLAATACETLKEGRYSPCAAQ